jgi:ribosomal protein S18 acetylase RimI-like enzyme
MDTFSKIEDNLRQVAAQSRDHYQLDGFDVFIDPTSDIYHFSLAVPTYSHDWSAAIQAMKATFAAHNRRARLEYLHNAHPELATLLEAAGFQRDMTAPVMVLTQDELTTAPETVGTLQQLTADSPLLEHFLTEQHSAFVMTGDALAWLPKCKDGLKQERLLIAGLEQSGRLVAGAMIQMADGTGELAGVWTRATHRKRGLAFAVCHYLLELFFESNTLCWLSAAEGAERLYQNLGFRPVATQLNYGLPPV